MGTDRKIIIIGAGLSGLTLAWMLSKQQFNVTILEASDRMGGRIQTVQGLMDTPLELGATWFSDLHTNLTALLNDLEIKKFPQHSGGISLFQTKSFEPAQQFYVPSSDAPSYRIAGGTQSLINALAAQLPAETIKLNSRVSEIRQAGKDVIVKTHIGTSYEAQNVVICIPPQLVASTINFTPDLPVNVQSILISVQTWMAGALKFVVEYDRPFWREAGFSGMLFSHAGIITEMYDQTDMEESKFGFTGFLNNGAASYPFGTRKELVFQQLTSLFGLKAANASIYTDKLWSDQYVLSGNQQIQRPHQNNGHPVLQNGYWNNSLHFCGTETATEFPGYMEGAIVAAQSVFQKLTKS